MQITWHTSFHATTFYVLTLSLSFFAVATKSFEVVWWIPPDTIFGLSFLLKFNSHSLPFGSRAEVSTEVSIPQPEDVGLLEGHVELLHRPLVGSVQDQICPWLLASWTSYRETYLHSYVWSVLLLLLLQPIKLWSQLKFYLWMQWWHCKSVFLESTFGPWMHETVSLPTSHTWRGSLLDLQCLWKRCFRINKCLSEM